MPEHTAAAAWLFGSVPTDRALSGWCPPVWIDLGNGQFRKEWRELSRWAPCRWSIAWHESVTPPAGEPL